MHQFKRRVGFGIGDAKSGAWGSVPNVSGVSISINK